MSIFRLINHKKLTAMLQDATEYCSLYYSPLVSKSPVTTVKYSISSVEDEAVDVHTIDRGEFLRSLRARIASVDTSFVEKLLEYMRERQLSEPALYKAAQLDRRLFSKITSDRSYKPSKDTCIALTLALRLDHDEATDLLSRAGYALSHSNRRDVIIEFFIHRGIYALDYVNEILHQMGEKTLGR